MTGNVIEILDRVRSRAAAMSRRSRWIAGLLAGTVLLGALWLAVAGRGAEMVPLDTHDLSSADLTAVQGVLADRGISCQLTSGRLSVSPKHLAAAREIVAQLTKQRNDATESLAALAREDDIWRTAAQNDKRWQAAKMATLSRLVETFPSVASATVLYEPGSPRGLGSAGQEPTAAVRVSMRTGATLTHSVALAIAELVSGSIAGMSCRHVRVVDASGQSYRFDTEPGNEDKALQHRREIETYYHEKIHTALNYIDKVVLAVSAIGKDDPAAELAVSVSVPRSYLAAVTRGGRGDPSTADQALAKIRQAVLAAADKPCQVKADWYYDTEPATLAEASASGSGTFGWSGVLVVAGLAAGCGAGSALLVHHIVRRRSNRIRQGSDAPGGAEITEGGVGSREAQEADRPWDFLKKLTTDETVSLVAFEHPQTIAIVLGQLEPARAAAVLTGLSEETQATVARRVAVLHQVSPVVIVEVGRTLADRAANLTKGQPPAAGTEGRMAEILRHAGYATEKVVLAALAGQSPSLVEAIRQRIFSFEDIAQLPTDRLRPALAHVDSAELAVALRTAGEDVKAKIFSAMPAEASRRVREEMEQMVPVRLSEVEAAQQRVAEAVRRAESGEYLSESARQERQLLA